MARESAARARATMVDARDGLKIPARAREMILSCAARAILSGHDGVTAREVAEMMRRTTCERTKRALVGEDGTNHAREESAFETLRDASAAGADARGGGGSGWTRRGEGGSRDVVFDLAGREYRPPRSWLGASRGGGKTKERRRRALHASVRDVLRMCRAAADEREGEEGEEKGRVFGDAAASPEKRSMARVNPLLELEAKDRERAEANKNKGKKNKKAEAKDAAPKKRKRRDLANEKAGNHLAIVSWIGEGKKDKVRRDRTFYDGFSREGVEYRTGDCVYCLPERTTEEMYVAQIQRCFEDEDESMMIECCWFMTQAEVLAWGGELPPGTHPNEIFLGTSVDVNPIAALEGIAPISTHADFIASNPSASSKTKEDERRLFARKCYVPAHGYDPKSKRQSKRKAGAFHPLHHVPGRGFVIQWPSSKKTKKGKR
jgi:hypothetical protein